MKNLKALLQNPAFLCLLALSLLTIGVGGYTLLADRSSHNATIVAAPADKVSAPVQQLPAANRSPEIIRPPVVDTVPAPKAEISVSKPEFIPDDTPVIVSAPQVVVPPLEGEVVTAFSMDRLTYSETLDDWRTHDGVDIAATAGDAVLAASAGTVSSVEDDPLMGTTIVIDHADGCRTIYANLETGPDVAEGDKVAAGQIIGTVGETAAAEAAQGPHLHFSVSKGGVPMDPHEYLG